MKKSVLLFGLVLVVSTIIAQVPSHLYVNNDAFKEISSLRKMGAKETPLKKMQQVNVKKLLEEDLATEGMDIPYRFGYGFDVNYTTKDGAWEELDSIRIWKLQISSSGAYSLNFIFEELQLVPDAELYIFNPNGSMVYGPVTAKQNLSEGTFLTDLIMGDEVIMRLSEPLLSDQKSRLKISRVVHAYKNLFTPYIKPGIGNALSCHNDIKCFPSWENESDAVALVLLSNGDALCSGALLNNTAQDYKPFFLTAFHCIDNSPTNNILSEQEINASTNWAFRFQYKKSGCNGSAATSFITYNRAHFRAAWQVTDFALMELVDSPVTNGHTQLAYLGWDRSGGGSSSGVGIHHPAGDVMKISFDNHSLSSNSNVINWTDPWGNIISTSPTNTHWVVGYDNGTTEGGSSGSPLFNTNKRVIGQLHGGQSGCAPVIKNYGQFHRSWSGGGTSATRLSDWLDPNNIGAMTTNTIRVPTTYILGSNVLCSSGSTYSLSYVPTGATVRWEVSSGLSPSSGTGVTFTVTPAPGAWGREHTITAVINNTVRVNREVWVGTPSGRLSILGPETVCQHCQTTYGITQDMWRDHFTGYIWNAGSGGYVSPGASDEAHILFPNVGPTTILAARYNDCGQEDWHRKEVYVGGIGMGFSAAYPNPAGDRLTVERRLSNDELLIKSAKSKVVKLELYSQSRQLVREQVFDSNESQLTLDVSTLPNGTYFLNIIENGKVVEQQTIVVKH